MPKKWSITEDNIMREYYNTHTIQEVMNLLSDRTKRSIRQRAHKLNLTKKDWTEDEVLFLKEHYKKKNYTWIADQLKRSTSSVQQKARLMGLKKVKSSNWSNEEVSFLKENFNSMTYDDMIKYLDRSIKAIYNKAWELGLSSKDNKYKKLKYNQRLFILNNCHKMTDNELGYMFGVSTDAIADLRKKNGIHKKPNSQSNKMTEPEKKVDKFLKSLSLKYEFNQQLGQYYPDFFVENKYVIEVQGDYFHCNPKLYPKGPNASQIEYIVNDYFKKCFYESNEIPVLYIWEHDIINNWHMIERKIKAHCRLGEKSLRLLAGKFDEG